MKTFLHIARSAFLALIVAGAISACDTTSALEQGTTDEQELEQFALELTSELSLSADQSAALSSTMARFGANGARDPGFLWRLAQELSTRLSDEQIQKLLDRAAGGGMGGGRGDGGQGMSGFGGRGNGGQGMGGFGGQGNGGQGNGGQGMGGQGMGGQGMGGQGMGDHDNGGQGGFMASILTEAQIADLMAIKEARRAEVQELLAAVRAARQAGDTAGAQAAMDAIQTLKEEVKAEIEAYMAANLTAEQQEAIAAAQAEHEAERAARQAEERAVMTEVLGITEAQADEILAAVETFRDAVQALERNADIREAIQALVTDLNGTVAATLNDDAAFEVFQIHQALAAKAGRQRRGGSGGGRSGRPTGGGSGG
jgi:hypothetical protein